MIVIFCVCERCYDDDDDDNDDDDDDDDDDDYAGDTMIMMIILMVSERPSAHNWVDARVKGDERLPGSCRPPGSWTSGIRISIQ